MKIYLLATIIICSFLQAQAQNGSLKGKIIADGSPLAYTTVSISGTKFKTQSNEEGIYEFNNLSPGKYELIFNAIGYLQYKTTASVSANITVVNVTMIKAETNLSEVIVTGVSRATEARKNPIPVVVISKTTMDQSVNNNLIDAIVRGVPGVTAVTTGPNISKPFIRGLGYNRVLNLYEGIRQEGQQWGDEHGLEIDQYAISRVEVVKGPASLMYGSDALGGVINMIPYLPDFKVSKVSGDFTTDYHTNNSMIASSLGLGISNNDWVYAFRATGKTAQSYKNDIDGVVFGTAFREYNFSATARVNKKWGFSQLSATLYNNQQEIPDGSRDSLTRKFTRQILDDGENIKNRPIVNDEDLQTYRINPLYQHIKHSRIYSINQFNLSKGMLNLLLGVQQSVRQEYNHPTLTSQPGLNVVLTTYNYDVKYNFNETKGWEATVGVNGMHQTNVSGRATDFPIPDYGMTDIGAFFFAKRSFGKVDLSGGFRYDSRMINWNDFYVGPNPENGFEKHITGPDLTGARLQFPEFKKNYFGASGSLGLTYNLTERILFKANIARGYRAPNITEIGSNGLDPGAHIVYLGNRSFKPEFNVQEDLGFIAYLKDLNLSFEVFNNQIQNYIYQAKLNDENGNPVIIVPGNSTYQYQQSKARLFGGEVNVMLHPENLKWFSLNTSLAYVIGLNKNQQLIDLHGRDAKYLPFIPPLHIQSELKLTAIKSEGTLYKPFFNFSVDRYSAQNKFYALDQTETYTAGYTLINAGIGTSLRNKSEKKIIDLFLQVDNLFDVSYQSNLNRLKYFEYYTASPNGKLGIYNMGRNFSFKVIVPLKG